MDQRLQKILDHHEIREVLAVYCHACDRADADLMASVYSGADSFDDHGLVKASGPDFCLEMAARIRKNTEAVSHILGQSLIRTDGDTAVAETFFLTLVRAAHPDGIDRINQLAGRFVDELVRVEGEWRVRHRTAVRDTSITLRVDEDAQAGHGMVAGRRDADDVGAALIGIAYRN